MCQEGDPSSFRRPVAPQSFTEQMAISQVEHSFIRLIHLKLRLIDFGISILSVYFGRIRYYSTPLHTVSQIPRPLLETGLQQVHVRLLVWNRKGKYHVVKSQYSAGSLLWYNVTMFFSIHLVIITARVRSTTEGNIFTLFTIWPFCYLLRIYSLFATRLEFSSGRLAFDWKAFLS